MLTVARRSARVRTPQVYQALAVSEKGTAASLSNWTRPFDLLKIPVVMELHLRADHEEEDEVMGSGELDMEALLGDFAVRYMYSLRFRRKVRKIRQVAGRLSSWF